MNKLTKVLRSTLAHIKHWLVLRILVISTERFATSESDVYDYRKALAAALTPRGFKGFKRDPRYQKILENCTKQDGFKILSVMADRRVDLRRYDEILSSDVIGYPLRYAYPNHLKPLSPTTLRYIKVAEEIKDFFGKKFDRIIEIGGGYGGQCVAANSALDIREYTICDLSDALLLQKKYLENFVLPSKLEFLTMNECSLELESDLVISNYSFSELSQEIQKQYISRVLRHARRGYITMNPAGDKRDENKLNFEALQRLLPKFVVEQEIPKSAPGNYLIVWGHK